MNTLNRTKRYESWGRYPKAEHVDVVPIHWQHQVPDLASFEHTVLPFGYGRSYGDSCLNNGGILLDPTFMQRFMEFDQEKGVLRCEAGVSFEDILKLIVPHGWFIAGTPGTKFISVGGAIANDVHGKGHHADGTFGRNVLRFELLRSDGERLVCSRDENNDLFRATIGGLGLTGLILWAEFQLKPIQSPFIDAEDVRVENIEEFFEITEDSEDKFEYTVSWIDCLATGDKLGRGIFSRGNHYDPPLGFNAAAEKPKPTVPFDFPTFAINPLSVRMFNEVYYRKQVKKQARHIIHYDPFFYPLDAVHNWHRIYGKRGFLQWQCVLPYHPSDYRGLKNILKHMAFSGQASFLTVIKKFGDIKSPGMLSFPREGITLAVDFAFNGQKTLHLCDELDEIVRECGGAMYPAKDARMAPETFEMSYPNWREFAKYVDPQFSSSFWRRVTDTQE